MCSIHSPCHHTHNVLSSGTRAFMPCPVGIRHSLVVQQHTTQQLPQAPQQRARVQLQIVHVEPPSSSSSNSSSHSDGVTGGSSLMESEGAFLLKLLAFSVVGAAVIKYGSLAISLPFEPNAAVALAVVLGTPAAFSLYLLTLGGKQQ